MTTAAQRIWEAIYAAEFVRRIGHGAAILGAPTDPVMHAAVTGAMGLASHHDRLVKAAAASTRSRFRRRSR